MRKFVIGLVFAACSLPLLSASGVQAQGAPWPPPPGMSAGEYQARYGHLVGRGGQPNPGYQQHWEERRWEAQRHHRQWEGDRRLRHHHYYDDDD